MKIKGIPKTTEFKTLMIELVKLLKPKVYMELGTKKGYMFMAVAPFVDKAIGVDCTGFTSAMTGQPGAKLFKCTTDELAMKLRAKEKINKNFKFYDIDLLFIDACHERDQVLRDFDNFSKYVKEGTGIIILHDTAPSIPILATKGYCHNAFEAAWEIRTNPKYQENFEIVTIPSIFGFSIIRKSKKQLIWV